MSKTYALLFFALTLIVSCKPKEAETVCPAFDQTTLNTWFPYTTVGSTYIFASINGGVQTLTIRDFNQKSGLVEAPTTGFQSGMKYCSAEGYVYSDTSTANSIILSLGHVKEEFTGETAYMNNNRITIIFQSGYYLPLMVEQNNITGIFSGDAFAKKAENSASITTPMGKTYNNVLTISAIDSTSAQRDKYDRLHIAKGHGIIGYRSYEDQQEYWLQ